MAATTLKLTDGITTLNLVWNSSTNNNTYFLGPDWSPRVAPLRRSLLGGRGPYADVVEEIPLHILGATAAACLTNLKALMDMLDKAERWTRGEYVNAVILQYSPPGASVSSSGNPLRALVLGQGQENTTEAMLRLPIQFNKRLNMFMIEGVQMRIVRNGQWLLGPIDSGTASSINSGQIATCTHASGMGGTTAHSPLSMLMGTWSTTNIATLEKGFVIVTGNTPNEDGIKVSAAPFNGAGGGGYSLINESANNAISGANTTRYTPASTAFSRCRVSALSWTSARRLAFFATVRNNDATKSYQIRAGYSKDIAAVSAVRTGISVIDGSSTSPRPIFIGVLNLPSSQYGDAFIEIAASATGGTIDIDQVVIVCIDDDSSVIVGHDGMNLSGTFGAGVNVSLTLQHNMELHSPAVTLPEPFVGVIQSGASSGVALTYRGDARLRTGLTEINTLWLTTSGTKWRFSQGGGSLQSYTVTPIQFHGHQVPV